MRNRIAVRATVGIVIIAFGFATPTSSRAAQDATGVLQGTGSVTVYSWGDPDGHAGAKAGLQHDTPTPVGGLRQTVVQIATSNSDTYALTSTGAVWAWGAGTQGELGNGSRVSFATRPTQVQFPAGVTIAWLPTTMPFDTAMAVDTEGRAWGWGYDNKSELCMSSYSTLLTPVELPLSDVTLAGGAGAHALFYSQGNVYACGVNTDGELGDGTKAASPTPTAVSGLSFVPVQALVTSWQGSGALMDDGSYYDWGYNTRGQLGDGSTTNSDVPVLVALPAAVTQVSQGGSGPNNGQTVALLSDGSVWSWGSGKWGQLGDGLSFNATSPVQVMVPSGVTFTQVTSGGAASYAIDGNGDVWAWGENNVGQLGTGGTASSPTPVSVGVVVSQLCSTAANVAGIQPTFEP